MNYSRLIPVVLTIAAVIGGSARAEAGDRRGVARGQGGRAAVPRVAGPRTIAAPIYSSRIVRAAPYRSYYRPGFGYRPGFALGFYAGFPYSYYGYGAAYYGYPYGYYGAYGYPYPPVGYVGATAGATYGSVRIEGAPREAQVFADGYYVGIVDDFDGAFQHLNLTPGPHRIEIRAAGYPPIEVDVRVEPGQTITYHADRR
jgi:hypothetical protein